MQSKGNACDSSGSCGHAQAAIGVRGLSEAMAAILVGSVAMLGQLLGCKGLSPVLSASSPYTSAAGTRCRILPAVQHSSN